MPIRFQCWQCQTAFAIGTRKAGTRIQCPVCNASQTVPCAPGTVLHPAAADSGEFPTPLNGPEEDFPVAAPAPRVPVAEAVPTCPSPPFQAPATAAPDRPRLPSFRAGSLVLALAVMLGVACWAFLSSAVERDNKRRPPPGPAEWEAGQPS